MAGKHTIRKIVLCGTTLLLMGAAGPSWAQLLFRQSMVSENYARNGYQMYGRTQISRSANPRYDNFGNYIMDGVQLVRWEETKLNSHHPTGENGNSIIEKSNPGDNNEYFNFYLDNLVMLRDSIKGFSSRFIVGNTVRVDFSPLTVDMVAMNGIRWDMNFSNNNVTFISSRADMPLWRPEEVVEQFAYSRNRVLPVYLTGAHIDRQFGIFNVAANYVNTYKSNSTLPRSQNSITGTLGHMDEYDDAGNLIYSGVLPAVRQIVVKLEDQSRYDGGGPQIYDIVAVVDGVAHPEYLVGITTGNWKDDFLLRGRGSGAGSNPNMQLYQSRYYLDPIRVPNYPLFDGQLTTGGPIIARRTKIATDPVINIVDIAPNGKDYLEANANEYLEFWFQLPTGVRPEEFQVRALVGNNYQFSVAEVYADPASDYSTPAVGQVGATYYQSILTSNGDVKDMSNFGWVSFNYGQPTANMLMSMRIDSDIKGFRFVSEYSRNMQFRQFPHTDAHKYRTDAEAYYITLNKEFGNFSFGTEYFKLDPNYSTSFRNADPAYANTGPQYGDDLQADPYLGRAVHADTQQYYNNTWIVDTVDDNDDKDQYPDYHVYLGLRDVDGIYPGLDKNGNNRPDVNENNNLMPDYYEPFFLYSVDPDEYDFGYDLNNNSTIDTREDDSKPDYPYNLNSRGYHLYTSYGTNIGWKYTIGYLNQERIAGGGITDVRYGSVEYSTFIPFFADVNFAGIVKKVEDSIQDDVYKFAPESTTTLVDSTTYGYNLTDPLTNTVLDDRMSEPYYDQLRYRDSYVGKVYLETNLFRIENLNVGIKLKYDINHQNEASFQQENDIIDRTQVYRAEYKYYFKDLLIQPQMKFMNRKYTNHDGYERPVHMQYFYPIIKMEYPLTMSTTFRFGMQGFPGLNSTVRNLVNSQLNYDTRDLVVMLSNKSFYNGYDFILNFGYQSSYQKFNGLARQVFNRTDKIFFVRMVVGLEPIS